MKLPDLEAWAIFAAVVEHRSISAAAAALGTSKATVSKAITRLETRLGATLFHRTSRRLVAHRRRPRARRARARDPARRRRGRGSRARHRQRPRRPDPRRRAAVVRHRATSRRSLAEFLRAHPGVTIDLRLSDALVDIVAEGIDVALRIADLPDSSLRARRRRRHPGADRRRARLSRRRRHARSAPPTSRAHACLTYTNAARPDRWRFVDEAGHEEVGAGVAGRSRPTTATRCCRRWSRGSASPACPSSSSPQDRRRRAARVDPAGLVGRPVRAAYRHAARKIASRRGSKR